MAKGFSQTYTCINSPPKLLLDNHKLDLEVSESVSVLYVNSLVLFLFRFHIEGMSYNISSLNWVLYGRDRHRSLE